MISDLEGCAVVSAGKAAQSRTVCSDEFFAALASFLDSNPKNKVAFLGDYFDLGDKVVDSINNIMKLYNAYSDRVIIILGNRDLNKLRLAFEMRAEAQKAGSEQWLLWTGFYAVINTELSLKKRMREILGKSMGAAPPYLGNMDALMDAALDGDQSNYLLIKAFSEPSAALYLAENAGAALPADAKYDTFVKNCRVMFQVGKIVHYEPSFQTLLSHAGGMDTFFFHNQKYYQDIKAQIESAPTYYDKMERARVLLMNPPTADQQAPIFEDAVYNSVLPAAVGSIDATGEPSPDFFLVQALGLKPDGPPQYKDKPLQHFVSFVQSCDNSSCSGPMGVHSPSIYDAGQYAEYLARLQKSGVQVISAGHAPHCAPIPMVYQRPEGPMMFIANDTSNGYRPAEIMKNETTQKEIVKDIAAQAVPLAYVLEGGVAAGVGSINTDDGSVMPSARTYTGPGGKFASMVGEWGQGSAPKFDPSAQRVVYADGKVLQFKGGFTPADMAGGRRRNNRKHTKKTQKKNNKKNNKRNKKSRKH